MVGPIRAEAEILFLKVGSWSFKGIIILQICILICQKVLFTKKYVRFSKRYRVKIIRVAVLRGFPNSAAHTS